MQWNSYGHNFLLLMMLVSLPNPLQAQFESEEQAWFCQNSETVEPCSKSFNSVDRFNNEKVYPVLQKLLQKDFFKFYKVNMDRPCPLWPDEKECSSKECGIQHCDDEVPLALRSPIIQSTIGNNNNSTTKDQKCNTGNQFDPIDTSLTEGDKAQLADMEYFEDTSDRFCDVEDDNSTDLHYVNLLKNPERYTGYKGKSAQKIWQCIYQENCFKPDPRFDKNFLLNPSGNNGMCLEKRVFYRLISGLHSAITVSIAAYNYKPAIGAFGSGTWFRNVEMFKSRFGTQWSWEGPERLMNIYFVYLLELKALVKIAPYLQQEMFYTGNDIEDAETRQAIDQFIRNCKSYDNHYDETRMFTGIDSQARLLREEFRQHFLNISRIMDCVGCDKCRLWGKLQTHGIGTALKILFSSGTAHSLPQKPVVVGNKVPEIPFKLTRNEVVALFQSIGRFSSTIFEINEFRSTMFPRLNSKSHHQKQVDEL